MEKLENQQCPVCGKHTLTLTEDLTEVQYFGRLYIFYMRCSDCKYTMSDIESKEQKNPCRYIIETESEKDMFIRIVKSSTATVSIPQLKMKMEPGANSIGFVSNIEGLLKRFEDIIEDQKNTADEPEIKIRAKNLLKKIRRVKLGDEKLKIIIQDGSGNSAIISPKAKIEKLKV